MFGRFVDISRRIRVGMPVWPGDPEVQMRQCASVAEDGYSVSQIAFGTHTGTHLDFEGHLNEGGTGEPPLETLLGPCLVATAKESREISEGKGSCPQRLLVKGGTPDIGCIKSLIGRGLRLIGVEAQSVEAGEGLDAHRILLDAGVVIIEGLDLERASAGQAYLIALPLPIESSDGAPARVILAY